MTDDSKALLLLDRPLRYEEKDYDFLERMRFAESLCSFLERINPRNGATVGVVGGWGVGKTTVLNFTEGLLRESEEGRFRVARFDPWLCEDPKDLMGHFLAMLALEVYATVPGGRTTCDVITATTGTAARLAGKLLGLGLDWIEPMVDGCLVAHGVPPLLSKLGIIDIAREEWQKARSRAHSPYQALMELKEGLVKDMENVGRRPRLVVFLDEIDRLQKDELRQLFKVIRMVCDLPGIAFVMAMDERRVSALLEADGGVDYHDKFLQTVFRVPEPAPTILRDAVGWVVAELSSVHRQAECDEKRLAEAKNVLVPGVIRNVRDLRRWAHALQFVVITHDDLDVIDLALMEALRIRDRDSFDGLAEDIRAGRIELFPADREQQALREMKDLLPPDRLGREARTVVGQETGELADPKEPGAIADSKAHLGSEVVGLLCRLVFPRLNPKEYDSSLSSGRLVHESNWISYHSQYDDRHAFIEREAERIAGLLGHHEAFVKAVEGLDDSYRRHCIERFQDKVGTHWPEKVPVESAMSYASHWRDWCGVSSEASHLSDSLIKAGQVLRDLALRSDHPERLVEGLESSADVDLLCAMWLVFARAPRGCADLAVGDMVCDRLFDWLVSACESGGLRSLDRVFRSHMLIQLGGVCKSKQRTMKPVLTPEDVLGLVGAHSGDITFSILISDMRRGLEVTFKEYVLRIAEQLLKTILQLFPVNRSEFLQLVRDAEPLVGELGDPHEIKAMQAVLEAMLDPQTWPEDEPGDVGDAESEA